MRPTRRWILGGMTSLLVVSCKQPGPTDPTDPTTSPTEPPPQPTGDTGEPAPTLQPGEWAPPAPDTALFPSGVQTGDATSTTAIISVLTAATDLVLTVVEQREEGWIQVVEIALPAGDNGYQLQLADLEPGARYRWAVSAGASWSPMGRFRTAPADDATPVFTFGATSCLGGNEPWPELSRAAEEDLDLFCFLGDTVYADWGAEEPVSAKWDTAMRQQGMRDVSASTALVATWDDHEVWNNWSPATTPESQWREALSQFRRHLPQTEGPNGEIWRSIRWGSTAELFVLDCRGERAFGRYMSDAQLDWLTSGLQNSPCRFKIVLNSVPATDFSFLGVAGLISAEDRWQGYPAQRSQLMQAAGQSQGVLFVSGDFHIGGAALVDSPQGAAPEVHEVLAGPGGSAVSTVFGLLPTGPRLKRMVAAYNYARFSCDPSTGEIHVQWIGASGDVIDAITIQA